MSKVNKSRLNGLQWAGAISALSAKILLAFSFIYGWPLAAMGYIFVWIYNRKKGGLQTLNVLVTGLFLLSVYGWFKWSSESNEVFPFDYLIISLTALFCIIFGYIQYVNKIVLWKAQIIASTLSIIAFLFIGMHIGLGWYALFGAHITLGYIYFIRKGYIFVVLQAISACVALYAALGF